jgi:hypothetical protein
MAATKNLTWPSEKMAKFIDLTPRRLRQLVDEGIVPREERGRYNPFAVTVAYTRFLRDRVQSPEASDSEFFAAKLAKLKAEREMIELQNQLIRRTKRSAESDRIHSEGRPSVPASWRDARWNHDAATQRRSGAAVGSSAVLGGHCVSVLINQSASRVEQTADGIGLCQSVVQFHCRVRLLDVIPDASVA